MTQKSTPFIKWMEIKQCSHQNDEVCEFCDYSDFDRYYADTYEDCPWR